MARCVVIHNTVVEAIRPQAGSAKKTGPRLKRYALLMAPKVKGRPRSTRLSRKNQVTVPVDVLRQVGLEPGDVLDVEAGEAGEVVLRRHKSRFADFIGSMPELELSRDDIDALRDEWDR